MGKPLTSPWLASLFASLNYAPGPFFFYPWKPLVQVAVGDSYHVGYRFFRRDHTQPTNICLHVNALAWQLLANFGWLATIDAAATRAFPELGNFGGRHFGGRPISALTAAAWAATLVASPAPRACSLASVGAIGIAFGVAPVLSAAVLELTMAFTFLLVYVGSSLAFSSKRPSSAKLTLLFAAAYAVRMGASRWHGIWAGHVGLINVLIGGLMFLLGLLPKPLKPTVFVGVFVCRPLAELTGQVEMLFFGGAFLAQLSQGLAHDLSRQAATLINHEASAEQKQQRLAFETSHVVYFPNLLFHSIGESLGLASTSNLKGL